MSAAAMSPEQESEILRLYESRAFEELETRFGSDPEASRLLFRLVREKKRGEELASVLSPKDVRPALHLRLLKNAFEVLDASLGKGLELFFPEPIAVRGSNEKPSLEGTGSLELGSEFALHRSPKGLILVFRRPGLPFDVQKDGEVYLRGNRLVQTELELEPGEYEIRYGDQAFSLSVE